MSKCYFKLMGVVLAGIALSAASGYAQDKATLDLLVKKGVITQEEASELGKQSVAVIKPKEKTTKKLTISGRVHTQFDYLNTDDDNAGHLPTTQQFFIRRAYVGIGADLGNGVKGEVEMDFAAGQGGTNQGTEGTRNNFSKVYIAKTFEDVGTFKVGYDKVNFVQEENTSSTKIKTVERSLATRYFAEDWNGGSETRRLGFASRHTGLFWQGIVPEIKGLEYSVALTNGQQSNADFGAGNGGMAYWASVSYKNSIDRLQYTIGLNGGYSQNGNSTATDPMKDIWGLNPYVSLKWGNFEMPFEFIWASVQEGRAASSDAQPWGINITPSYKLTEDWEVVARFSYLDTNGRGVRVSDGIRNAPSASINYDRAYSVYAGINWYIIGNSLKLTAGYEYAHFESPLNGMSGSADSNGARVRLQLLF